MPSPLLDLLAKFRQQEMRQEAVVLSQLGSAYAKIYERLQAQIELEVRRMLESEGRDALSRAYIRSRLGNLFSQVEDELGKYSAFVETSIDANIDDMLTLGTRHALEMMRLSGQGVVGINFGQLSPQQINTMIGFLAPGSPLRERIGQMAGHFSGAVQDTLVEAIALGYNPYKTGGLIAPYLENVLAASTGGFAQVLATAITTARTAQLWTYREATRDNFQANSDVVPGWQWYASEDELVCPACLSLHGSIHPLDEPLEGHHNCRCAMLPILGGETMIPETAGRDYYDSLSDSEQRDLLGPGMYDALNNGQIEFSDLHQPVENDVYGTMQTTPTLSDLLSGETEVSNIQTDDGPPYQTNDTNWNVDTSDMPLAGSHLLDYKDPDYVEMLERRAGKGTEVEILRDEQLAQLREFIDNPDYRLDIPETVYFGIDSAELSSLGIGDTFDAIGTRSTAYDYERALSYAGNNGTVFQVTVPDGAVAIHAQVFDLQELMLLPGAQFEITGRDDNVTFVNLISDGSDFVRYLLDLQDRLDNISNR